MNRPLASVVALLLAILLCFPVANGQQNNSTAETQSANAALREKAFKLLESLADQLGTLQSAENRARMGSNIAESLWTRDETRARQLFKLVEDDIKLGLQQLHEDDPRAKHTFEVFLKLRDDNVHRIAKHDPELALAFLKETFLFVKEVASDPDGSISPGIVENEHALELRLAKSIGPRNADVAVQLARQSLERGLSDDLLLLLSRLNKKNRDQAQTLYNDIVRRLDDADFNQYYPTVHFAQQLAGLFTPPAVDESTYKELANVFFRKAFAAGCERPKTEENEERTSLCVYIGAVLPLLAKYSPAQARRLGHWAPENGYTPDWITPAYAELNDLVENGTIDEILELVSKYPQLQRQIYARAMARAEADGDLERFRKITSGMTVPERPGSMEDRTEDLSEAKLDEQIAAMQTANLTPRQQAEGLLRVASYLAPRNRKLALKLLDRVGATVNTFPPGESQTVFQIAMASVYCFAKDDGGFGIMESLMPKLNELIASAAKLDGYDTRYLRDDEWNMTAGGSIGNILTFMAHNAGYFAWYDFDRAVTLSGQFERSEIRMMAQLKLAQGILAGPPKTLFGPLY
ncbi:MAG TPA: hypothetical protein VGJ37_19600 [Pyrinomonadaceae bacterium]|jgi:hypothetical protein